VLVRPGQGWRSSATTSGVKLASKTRCAARRGGQPAEPCSLSLAGAGRVRGERALRQRVHESGVQPAARREVWKFLLGFYPMDSTASGRAALLVPPGCRTVW